eukprot:CAMPEP_0113321722 /NCGR_PEP_ID=MMETSP0010_2-20120614/15105_1 /TAXON_ID=216773 ORGANISM="Corethron hystrix, Strain 308" /NCGR_SAMPLE_ID=MMETSP0010_2 /ASSEMBLY_ACC=CAM_ASM_000155 /LENGTH=169 /DNA_ID=CAMNT_0000179937 /DNA_START=60 /DNA_END=566 /DNA_ORIENTATION=+ /assembly_acc=CAM_ASM_000155
MDSECGCKRGRCHTCGSSCRRCKCECDGFSIAEKLARKGKQKIRTADSVRSEPLSIRQVEKQMYGTNQTPNYQEDVMSENEDIPPPPKKQKIIERTRSTTAVAQLKNLLGLKPKAGNSLPSYSKRTTIEWNDMDSNSCQVLVSFLFWENFQQRYSEQYGDHDEYPTETK